MAEKSCLDAAVAMLARREHAVKELKTKLLRKKFAPGEVMQAIEKLIKNGLLSDVRYAHARARYRAGVSRWGAGKIRQELQAVCIEKSLIEQSLNALPASGLSLQEGANKLAKRAKLGALERPADPALGLRERLLTHQKQREKMLAKLLRRGFSLAEARAAIAEAEAENPE